jgi:surface polysaccharide O-acyltransferase-like enzyme
MKKDRICALDVIRFTALLLVVLLHSAGHFYIDQSGRFVVNPDSIAIVSIATLGRAGVPLFVIISGYLLLPVHISTREFFLRRLRRILLPFLFWSIVYAIYESDVLVSGDVTQLMKYVFHIPINFVTAHLWYVYMLIGLYCLAPIISPWIEKVGKKQMLFFLLLWLLCTLSVFIHLRFKNILGEVEWNHFSSIYYFQGFIGYFVFGGYLKKYGMISFQLSLGAFLMGLFITILLIHVGVHLSLAERFFNSFWDYCSFNIALMSLGLFGIIYHWSYNIRFGNNSLVVDISRRSYAIYLAHIIVLRLTSGYVLQTFDSALLAIPLIVIVVLVFTYLLCRLMSKLPYADKWLG